MIKTHVALTIEEMKELQTRGVDTSDASLCWLADPDDSDIRSLFEHDENCYEMKCLHPIPTYTMEDILMKIDACIIYHKFPKGEKGGEIYHWECHYDSSYNIEDTYKLFLEKAPATAYGETPMEAAYSALKIVAKYMPHKIKTVRPRPTT